MAEKPAAVDTKRVNGAALAAAGRA